MHDFGGGVGLNIKFVSLIVAVGMSMFLFTMGSSATIQYVTTGQHILPENTVIASVNVSDTSQEEAVRLLTEGVEAWKQSQSVTVKLDDKQLEISPDLFVFHIEETIDEALRSEVSDLKISIEESYIAEMESHMSDSLSEEFSTQQFIKAVKRDAAQLTESPLEYVAYDFVDRQSESLYVTIGEQTADIPEETEMDRAVDIFDSQPVQNGDTFSFTSNLKEDGVYDEVSLDVLASAIYGASLKAGLIIQERHISHRLPEYAEIGLEANVDVKQQQDLKVYNPFSGVYQLAIKVEDSQVRAQWIGYPTTSDFHVQLLDKEKILPKTTIQYSTLVNGPSYNLLQEGEAGEVVSVYRTDRSQADGIQEFVSEDYYPPVSRVEEHPVLSDSGETDGTEIENEKADTENGISERQSETNLDKEDEDSSSSENVEEETVWEENPNALSK